MKAMLAGISVFLGAVLLLQWKDWPPSAPSPPEPRPADALVAPAQQPEAGANDFVLSPSREEYAAVTERPLFLPERRPPPEGPDMDEEVGPEELTELDGTDLTAVVITPSVVSGWVRSPAGQEVQRLRLGDNFEGWTVKTIEPGRMVFERQGEINELILRDYENAPAATPRPAGPMRRPRPDGRQPGLPRRVPVAESEPPELPPDYDH
jgi:general secretion pathway protein N